MPRGRKSVALWRAGAGGWGWDGVGDEVRRVVGLRTAVARNVDFIPKCRGTVGGLAKGIM